MGEAPVWFG